MQQDLLKTEWRGEETSPKRLRKEGWIPGVIYGKNFDPIPLKVEFQKLKKFLHHSGKIFEVEVDGKGKHLVNVDHIQKDHLGTVPVHISFHKLVKGQESVVTLPLHFVGEIAGAKQGGVLNHAFTELDVKGLPSKMPDAIDIDVSSLDIHQSIHVNEISLPEGLKFVHIDPEQVIASCIVPKLEVVEEPAVEAVPVEGAEAPVAQGESTPADEGKGEGTREEVKKAS